MAVGTYSGASIRIAVGFHPSDWDKLNQLAKTWKIPVTTLIRKFTLEKLDETC